MEILLMVGADAGKVRDVQAFYAHRMIERGEAIDPNQPMTPAALTLPTQAQVVSEIVHPPCAKGRRGHK